MQYVKEIVKFGPRPLGSASHKKVEEYISTHLKGDQVEDDIFTADTPEGKFPVHNIIAKYPGTKDGIIIIAREASRLFSVGAVHAKSSHSDAGVAGNLEILVDDGGLMRERGRGREQHERRAKELHARCAYCSQKARGSNFILMRRGRCGVLPGPLIIRHCDE